MTYLEDLKARVRERLDQLKKEEEQRPPLIPAPRYDDIYFKGRAWLDSLAYDPEESLEQEREGD